MDDSKALLALLGVAGLGLGIYFLVRKPAVGAKWEAGDEIWCYIKNTQWEWSPFYIAEVATRNGVLSYHVYDGHPPGITYDSGWFPVSEVDKLNCRKA